MVYFIFDVRIKYRRKTKKVCFQAMKKPTVACTEEIIKIGPPLTISKDAIKEGLKILEDQISDIWGKKMTVRV